VKVGLAQSPVIAFKASPACLRVPNLGVAFTERGQHSDRHTSEPAFPVGTLLAQYRSSI
jgi:hypothetical protein